MKIAALYDIHGNLPALEAVLAEIEKEAVDLIVVGGDLCWGPMPRPTLDLLQSLDRTRFIMGNADREVGSGRFEPVGEDRTWIAEVNTWCHSQLTADQQSFLEQLPPDVVIDHGIVGPIHFCHGSPRSDEEAIRTTTPDEEIAPMLQGIEAGVIVCGHTHEQFDRVVEGKRVVNAGSVGLPYDGPSAAWLYIDTALTLRRTDYNFVDARASFLASGVPHAEVFADNFS